MKNFTFPYQFLGDKLHSPEVLTLTRIDDMQLIRELSEIPSHIAYWNAVCAEVTSRVTQAEAQFEVFCAMKDSMVREALSRPESKIKVTEKVVEGEVSKSPEYQNWKAALIALRLERDNAMNLANSLRNKLSALTVIAGLRRAEAAIYSAGAGASTA